MSFKWSDHATHIQRLYHPWSPNDGYTEDVVIAVEQKLSLRFPSTLRHFYRAWGARDDLTRTNQTLLRIDDVFLHDDALVICVENQWVWYWAIPYTALTLDNPPISIARNEELPPVWEHSHTHLSDFLDYLTYQHAFDGGAIHGAYSHEWVNDDLRKRMYQYGQALVLPTYPPWFVRDETTQPWSLIRGDQYAMDGLVNIVAATCSNEVLDHISETLHITWERRW
jgi:hypothetical protein